MNKIAPCLWFDDEAEEAARFYVSVFKNSRIKDVVRYGAAGAEASGRRKGSIMTVSFRIEGQDFLALNGGPRFKFTPALSLMVSCRTQGEIDGLWKKLTAGGEPGPCGWLTDKYGVSWQIVPADLDRMLRNKDSSKTERAMRALLSMSKLDVRALRRASAGA